MMGYTGTLSDNDDENELEVEEDEEDSFFCYILIDKMIKSRFMKREKERE